MKRFWIFCCLCLGVAIAVVASFIVPDLLAMKERDRANEEGRILGLLLNQVEAWNRGDLDGFMAGYWDSPELEFVSKETTKGFQPTKDGYYKRYKSEGKEMGTLTFSDISVTLIGEKEAKVTGKWKLKMSKESPSGGFTLTLKKFDVVGWKIVKDVTTSDEPPKKE